jgi:hypothetical protein
VFAAIQRHDLWEDETLHRTFVPELTELQSLLLELLDVPESVYASASQGPHE